MITRMWIPLACLLVVVVVSPAQEAVTAPPEAGWTGIVAGQDVNVRSGPDLSAYPCTQLSGPDRVTVVAQEGEWLKILPPASCFSVVHKNYLELDADGKTATVTSENVWTRAGGDLRMSDFWALQRPLTKGQKVEIIGPVNDYYKIVPPAGTCLYVSSQFVQRAPKETVPAPATQPAVPDEPTAPMVVKPAVVVEPKPPATQPELSPRDSFLAAEKALQAEFQKPEEQQDFAALLARYQRIDTKGDAVLARFVSSRLSYLRAAADVRQGNRAAKALLANVQRTQQEYERQLAELAAAQTAPSPRAPVPAAEGVLRASVVYSGGGGMLRRYLVYNPATQRVVAFAQSAGIDLQAYAGKYVNLYGAAWYDRQTMLDVVEVEQVEVVSNESVGLPSPPRPVIKPLELETLAPPTEPAGGSP